MFFIEIPYSFIEFDANDENTKQSIRHLVAL